MTDSTPPEEATEDDYRAMVTTNLDSAFFLCKLALPLLRNSRHASVVNVSSLAGIRSSGARRAQFFRNSPRNSPTSHHLAQAPA